LKEILASGPLPQKDVKAASEGIGLSWATVRRAKSRLGINAYKDGMDGGLLWALPKMPIGAEDADRNIVLGPSSEAGAFPGLRVIDSNRRIHFDQPRFSGPLE
jgi:hypothetical protein